MKYEKCQRRGELNSLCVFESFKPFFKMFCSFVIQMKPKIILLHLVRAGIVHRCSQSHLVAVGPTVWDAAVVSSFSSSGLEAGMGNCQQLYLISVCHSKAAIVRSFIMSDTLQLMIH